MIQFRTGRNLAALTIDLLGTDWREARIAVLAERR